MIEWKGYAPDLANHVPGIFRDCENVIPTVKGFAGAPTPALSSLLTAAVAATAQGAADLAQLDQTTRFFVGTTAKLYEAAATAWTDRTRASGGDYSVSAAVRWRFDVQNSVCFAVAKSDTLQFSASGAFADVSGAPKASIVTNVGNFLFLFDTNEAVYGDSLNRWWCSALGDYTDWTPSVATQCTTGLLTATAGKITGAKRFGEAVIVYKEKSMYLGVYVGPPAIWEFRLLPEDAGALSQEAIIDIGEAESPKHVFMGYDDFYFFDGSRAVPIGDANLKESVFRDLKRTKQGLAMALHDRQRSNVYFFYPSDESNLLKKCVVFNYYTNKWGRDDRSVQVVASFTPTGLTYADAGTAYSTYGDVTGSTYENTFSSSLTPVPAVFDTTNTLKTLTGSAQTSSITTGEYGDNDTYSSLHRVKVHYESNPTSATMTNYYKYNAGDADTTDTVTTETNSRFDVLRSARWHKFRFDFVGDWEAAGMRIGAQIESNE